MNTVYPPLRRLSLVGTYWDIYTYRYKLADTQPGSKLLRNCMGWFIWYHFYTYSYHVKIVLLVSLNGKHTLQLCFNMISFNEANSPPPEIIYSIFSNFNSAQSDLPLLAGSQLYMYVPLASLQINHQQRVTDYNLFHYWNNPRTVHHYIVN